MSKSDTCAQVTIIHNSDTNTQVIIINNSYRYTGTNFLQQCHLYTFILQLLDECRCWCTRESPSSHVATFSDRRQLIRLFERIDILCVKTVEIVTFGGFYHHVIRLLLNLELLEHNFPTFQITLLGLG